MNIDFFLFSLILGIFLNLFFGFFIIFKNPFNSSARWLLAFSLVNFAWVVSSYLAVFYQGEETTIWILRTVIFLAIWQGFTLNFFVKIYPQKKYKYLNLELYIVTPATVLVSLFCFTEYYFKSVELLDGLYQPVPGLFIPVFAFYSILLVAYGIYVLAKKLWLNPQSRDLKFIFTGVLLMFSSIIVLNFILPIFFNINNFIGFSAIFTLPFVVFASYGILKDSTYDLKTITTEIFVYLYWGMTFFFVFLTEGILAKTFVTFLFLASIVLGILIIKSVRKEVDEKDRVIKLNKEVEQQKKEIEKCAPPIQAQAKKESRKTEIKQNDDQSQKIPVQIELKLNQLEQTTKPQAVVIKPKPNEKQDNQFVLQDNQVVLLIAIFIVVLFVIAGILYFPNTQPATEFPKKMPDSIATPSNTPEPQNTTTLDKPTTVMLGEGTTKAEIYDTVISPNGYFVASVGAEKQVYLWRVANGSLISKLDGQTDGARTVAFSPDSQLIASGCDDKSVRIWKTNDGSLYKELKGHTDYVFRVGFSQDGEKLISAGGDKKVKTWQVNDGALLKDTSFYETLVTIASDIDTVALYNDNNEITFWSFSDGKQLSSLVTKTVKIRSVTYGVFSPNQKIFALGNKYGEVNLWNAKKGNLLVNFSPSKGQVVSITFSQDSQNVSVGYSSGIIKIYSSTDGSLLYQQMMENSQQTTALSADGKVIVSANNKTKLQIWQINY